VSLIVLLILAVPLSQSSPRQGRYGRLIVAVLIFVIYYNLLGVAEVWLKDGVVPPVLGMWWVAVLPVLLTVALLNRGRLPALFGRSQ
jgi:lipopolysaccharide export system permease protein